MSDVSGMIPYVDGQIIGKISNTITVQGGLTVPDSGSGKIPRYDGSYEVVPLAFTDTVMNTDGKRMEDDVTILAIPYYETTNEGGGYTVIIG